ncbi:MAG: hypothetical protein ACR2PH_01225 [Desulfobulbia bacterium]
MKDVSGSKSSNQPRAWFGMQLRLLRLRLWTLAKAFYCTGRGKGEAGKI